MLAYPVELRQDDNDTLVVSFPDFPEAHTFGADRDEALRRAQDALVTVIDEYVRRWQPIPAPSAGRPRVPVPALTAAKMQLYDIMQRQGIGKAELARRLDWHPPQVDRLFDVFHHSRLDRLEAAFAALGQHLVVTTVESQAEHSSKPTSGGGFKPARFGFKAGAMRRTVAQKATAR
jgi:antitoxin HicB